MDLPTQGTSSSLTNKRKRGRPRRDETNTQQQPNPSDTAGDEILIGQVVSGVVEGSFEAGYFLSVNVAHTERQLKGVIFLPDKVTPVTPTTDLFPQAKMYTRGDFTLPSFNQQYPPQHNQTDDIVSHPQTNILIADKNQSANHPSEAVCERNHPIVTHMKDVGGSFADEKLAEPEGQTLSLMPEFTSDDAPKEDHTVQRSEASAATPETTQKQTMGSSATLSLELFQNETKRSGTEWEKSLAGTEPRALDLMLEENPASPTDDVPEELQLELGNKKMSGSAVATGTNTDQAASPKTGVLVNLNVGREETVKEPSAASESGFPEVAQNKYYGNDSREVDGNIEEAVGIIKN